MECERCGGSGWVLERESGVAIRCRCRFERLSKRFMEESRIPPRYSHCTFSSFEPETPLQLRALKVCREFFYAFPFVEKGILLYGNPGTGKTHLAVAILRNVIKYKGLRGIFCDFRNLLLELKSTFDTEESETEVLEGVMKSPLLVLDDVGAERVTEWARDRLETIINYRYAHKLPTIVTTNLTLDGSKESFYAKFGERIESRLYEMCTILRLDGNDRRKSKV